MLGTASDVSDMCAGVLLGLEELKGLKVGAGVLVNFVLVIDSEGKGQRVCW